MKHVGGKDAKITTILQRDMEQLCMATSAFLLRLIRDKTLSVALLTKKKPVLTKME